MIFMDSITLIFVINQKCLAVTSRPNNNLFLLIFLRLLCVFQGADKKKTWHTQNKKLMNWEKSLFLIVCTEYREIRNKGSAFQGLGLYNPRPKMARWGNSGIHKEWPWNITWWEPRWRVVANPQPQRGREPRDTLTSVHIGQTQPEVCQLVMKFIQLSLPRHPAG